MQDFIAFELLTNVDNIYCQALPYMPIKDALSKELHLEVPKLKKKCNGCKSIIYYTIANILEKFFALIYFYFTPFAILMIPYLFKYFSSHHTESSSAGATAH